MKFSDQNKHGIIAFATVVSFVLPGSVIAARSRDIQHTFDLGGSFSSIKYKEPGVMEESGVMVGLLGSYTLNHASTIFKIDALSAIPRGSIEREK